jgi:dUTP pyrophosphatase
MRQSARRLTIEIRRLAHADGLPLPAYQSADAAGMDLVAAISADGPLILKRGTRALVPTGLALELLPGTEAQVRPRSGIALKYGVTVLNSPGTIDADFRGEICVILINLGNEPFHIMRGDRIAQMIFAPVTRADLSVVGSLTETKRSEAGFGSTGVASTNPTKSAAKRTPVAPKRNAAKTATKITSPSKRQSPSKR